MIISFSTYLKQFFNLDYKDYLLISSDDKRNFYFTEYRRFVYSDVINLVRYKSR